MADTLLAPVDAGFRREAGKIDHSCHLLVCLSSFSTRIREWERL